MRDSVREINGLLSNSDLHTQRVDRHHFVGQFLAKQMRDARSSIVGGHYRVDHDHAHVIDQCRTSKDFIRQIYRRVLGHVFRHGVRLAVGLV